LNRTVSSALLLAGIVILMSYSLIRLGRVPADISDDDGAYASAAYQFWETGRPGVPGYKDVVNLEKDVWPFGRIAAAVEGVFLHFFGVSIFAALLPSFLAGVLLLVLTIALGHQLWDPQTGLLAALLLAASGKFFDACRWARPDILLATFFMLGLWLVASASTERPYVRLFLAGLVMGLAGDVHLNGFILAPVPLVFWLLLRKNPASSRFSGCLQYCLGGLLGLLYWLAVHVWMSPINIVQQAAVYGGATHGLRVLKLGLWASIEAEIHRYTSWFWSARGHRHLFEGLCVLAGGLWLLFKEKRVGISMVCAWLMVFMAAALFMANPFGWYLIYVWPIFALWMARLFQAPALKPIATVAMIVLMAAYLLNFGLWEAKARKCKPVQFAMTELRHLIPPESPVVGNGIFWFAFWDRDFTDELYLRFRELEANLHPASVSTGWELEQRKKGWQYIVAADGFSDYWNPEVPLSQVESAATYPSQIPQIHAARSFSLARCTIVRRIVGFWDNILVLRVTEGDHHVAR
jgi:4-amino-4-deoxy-L-arabinose transferase-like glycosyltransferase